MAHLNQNSNSMTMSYLPQHLSLPTIATQSTPTFHPFPHLPYELRIKIWAYAIPDSFLKTAISFSEGRGCIRLYRTGSGDEIIPRFFPHARIYPVLFAVNREARFEVARIDGGT
ncbi:hypothetical protein IAQ61_002012 [Plenodomus lingam]|uniref:uncharacterized protein n=1 Tax=Leptosphaeria maculans TaxID=5022 RepID=UPI003322EBAE|nr:hypothetical protein IAQ61_002012 [Plenodomus lingam]